MFLRNVYLRLPASLHGVKAQNIIIVLTAVQTLNITMFYTSRLKPLSHIGSLKQKETYEYV